jgi:hypothetical protein
LKVGRGCFHFQGVEKKVLRTFFSQHPENGTQQAGKELSISHVRLQFNQVIEDIVASGGIINYFRYTFKRREAMKTRFALVLLIFLLALGGCSPASQKADYDSVAPSEPGYTDSAAGESSFGRSAAYEMPAAAPQTSQANAERLVIRNANLSIVVEEPAQAMMQISRMAESMNGYVVNSNLYKTTSSSNREVPEANITIRVPAAQLNSALEQIKALVKEAEKDVITENISGQDVTSEYTDLNSRLTNLEEAEKQLREIMGSAVKTEDVLAVHQQLTYIRSEIEMIKGQMKYYRDASALSSISVSIKSQASVQPLEIAGWQPVGVARDAVQATIDTMQFLATTVIWIVLYVLPVALVIFIPLRLAWIVIRRNSKNRPQKLPQAPPAAPQS